MKQTEIESVVCQKPALPHISYLITVDTKAHTVEVNGRKQGEVINHTVSDV